MGSGQIIALEYQELMHRTCVVHLRISISIMTDLYQRVIFEHFSKLAVSDRVMRK